MTDLLYGFGITTLNFVHCSKPNRTNDQLMTDLQFSEPPARHVLAKDNNELSVLQSQLLGSHRGMSSDHLSDLCVQRNKCNVTQQQEVKTKQNKSRQTWLLLPR